MTVVKELRERLSTSKPIYPPSQRSRWWLLIALVLVIVWALPNVTEIMGIDQATYCVVARGLLHGQKIYRDVWDIKPPGISLLYTPIVKLLGSVMWSVPLLDFFWLLAISYCVFRFAERYLGGAAAALAVLANTIWHCRAGYTHAAQPENFIVLLAFASYFLVWRESRWTLYRHLAAGVLMGAAFWLKYNAIAFVPFLLFAPWLEGIGLEPPQVRLSISWRAWLNRAIALLGGLALVILAELAYFRAAGLWAFYWRDHFRVVRHYATPAMPRGVIGYIVHPFAVAFFGLGAWILIATVIALVLAVRTDRLRTLAPVFLGELFGFGSAMLQFRVSSYEFETCYPFAAIVWAYLVIEVFRGIRALAQALTVRWNPTRVLVWALFAAFVFLPARTEVKGLVQRYGWLAEWRHNPDQFYANYPAPFPGEHTRDLFKIIDYLRDNTTPQDKVYVWGNEARISYLLQLSSPTRFVLNVPLVATWGPPEWKQEVMEALERLPPTFIVVARNDGLYGLTLTDRSSEQSLKSFPELDSLIAGSYHAIDTNPTFALYRRNGALRR